LIGKILIETKLFAGHAMITSKVTSKAQTTIPQPIRAALHLMEGDKLAYVIEKGRVILTKAHAKPIDDPFGVFTEWDGDADRKAYAKL
jgi:antitoxin PrlF